MTTDAPIPLDYDKPFPAPDELSRPFFDGTLRGELVLQHCTACGQWMWPVRFRCTNCLGADVEWKAVAGTGTIYTFTIIHQVFHPGFASSVPYNVTVVDLDEGVRFITNVIDVANDELRIGSRVGLVFERVSEHLALPKCRLLA